MAANERTGQLPAYVQILDTHPDFPGRCYILKLSKSGGEYSLSIGGSMVFSMPVEKYKGHERHFKVILKNLNNR